MGDPFSANGIITNVAASPGTTALAVLASLSRRGRIHFFAVSVGGTPVGDNILRWLIRRITVDGTGTVVVPSPLDVAAPAALLAAKQTYTAEPTFGATIFDEAIHMRSIYHWNATPKNELVIPATAGAGIGFTPSHASYTGTAQATAHWEE